MNAEEKIVKENAESKKNMLNKQRKYAKCSRLTNLLLVHVDLVAPIGCACFVFWLFHYNNVIGMDIVLDFIIAGLSGALLVYSLIDKFVSDDLKYKLQPAIVVLVYTAVFGIIVIIAFYVKDGKISRGISLIVLVISSIVELKDYYNFQKRYIDEKYNQLMKEIDELSNKSIMSGNFRG